MHATLDIAEQAVDGATVLTLGGELDLAAAPRLSGRLNELIRTGEGDVVLDLRAVSFVDSTGLAVLLNSLRRLTRARRRLALVFGTGAVQRTFRVTRLQWTFDVFADVESALERSRRG